MRGSAVKGEGRAVSEWCPQSLIIAVDCLGVPNEIKDECVGAGQWPVDAARCTLLCTPRPGYYSRPWPRATLPLHSDCSWHLLLYLLSRICSTIRSTPLPLLHLYNSVRRHKSGNPLRVRHCFTSQFDKQTTIFLWPQPTNQKIIKSCICISWSPINCFYLSNTYSSHRKKQQQQHSQLDTFQSPVNTCWLVV